MKKVLMLGPDLDTRGGMAAIEKQILENAKSVELTFVATFKEGNYIQKLLFAAYSYLRFMIILFKKRDIGTIYIHVSHYASFFRKSIFLLTGFFFRKRVFLHMHGSDFDIFYDRCSKLVRKYIRFVLKKAHKIIVLSMRWKEYYSGIADISKIELVYNSVCVPEVNNYNPSGEYISFLGNLGKRKGIYDIIKIVPKILADYPDIKFLLAGDGDVKAVGEKLKSLGVETRVMVPGWIDKVQSQEILKNSIMYLLPSYNEGLPLSVLEAMSNGVPVISTRIGGLNEVITDERYGILIEPGDLDALEKAVRYLLADEELRRKISHWSYYRIKECFNLNLLIGNIERILLED